MLNNVMIISQGGHKAYARHNKKGYEACVKTLDMKNGYTSAATSGASLGMCKT
jgi:hypothetical protein